MKVPYDFNKFLREKENKEALLNLIEQAIDEGKEDLGNKVIFFSNKSQCKKITAEETSISYRMSWQVITKKPTLN